MPDRDVLDELRGVPILSEMDEEPLVRIARIATEFEAPANQVLIERGHVGSGMFILEEGEVVVELPGRDVRLGPGEYFGEMALLSEGGKRTARVRTATPIRGLAISRSDFAALIEEQPRLALVMLPVLARRLALSDDTHTQA